MDFNKEKTREEFKNLIIGKTGDEQIFNTWWDNWGSNIMILMERESLDISAEEGIRLIGRILHTFRGLDKRAQGWLIRLLVIVYDYFTYKYDPEMGLNSEQIVALLADKTSTKETDITEAIRTLRALRMVSTDMFTGDGNN